MKLQLKLIIDNAFLLIYLLFLIFEMLASKPQYQEQSPVNCGTLTVKQVLSIGGGDLVHVILTIKYRLC